MSTDFIDSLSDVELHQKLLQQGFANLPVTETTRKILIKKLKNHLINNEKAAKMRRHTANKKRAESLSDEDEYNVNSWNDQSTHLAASNNKRSMYNVNNNGINHRSNINSSLDNNHYGNNVSATATAPAQQPQSMKRILTSPKMYAPPPILASESENESDHYRPSSNNIRKAAPLSCGIDASKYYGVCGVGNDTADGGVVSRLLSLRDTTLQRKNSSPPVSSSSSSPYAVDESRKMNRFNRNSLNNNYANNNYKSKNRTVLSYLKSYLKKKPEFNQIFIPYVLIGALIVFFLIIGFVYMSKKYDLQNTINADTTRYQLCNSDQRSRRAYNCVHADVLDNAIAVDSELIRMLHERARAHYCVDANISPMITATELIRALRSLNIASEVDELLTTLYAAEYLIIQNPQWQINLLNSNGMLIASDGSSSSSSEPLSAIDLSFVLTKPLLPLKCVLFNKMQRFFFIIGTLSLFGLMTTFVYGAYRYLKMWKSERILAADHFTKDIVNELLAKASTQTETTENCEIIINHLRDKLIPLNKRRKLLWSWNEALRLLEENDSRIQFGATMRNGEEFRTMKWTGNMDERDFSSKKKWQSPAFDNVNRIVYPPTPCLKIRHMFDATEINQPNLKQLIIDAIMEKVGASCKICDIQLDKQSCCVYLRCATEVDAGVVHNKINGWWFDKRLISIKFLRLQRYMSRFPKSSNEPMCFLTPNLNNLHKRS